MKHRTYYWTERGLSELVALSILLLPPQALAQPAHLSPECYDSSTTPNEFVRICDLIVHADERVIVHGEDFGYRSEHAFGRLAVYDAYAKSNDEATLTAKRLFKEADDKGKLWWRRKLAEATPATAKDQILVVDVFYLVASVQERTVPVPVEGVLDKVCSRVATLGYKRVLIMADCVRDGHPGYRVWRELKE